VSQFDM